VLDVRVDHGAQRVVLQVRELRHHERVRVTRGSRLAINSRLATLEGWLILPLGGHNTAERRAGASRPFLFDFERAVAAASGRFWPTLASVSAG
jgi:hypothetical protein